MIPICLYAFFVLYAVKEYIFMKKLIICFLSVILILSFLSSCGRKNKIRYPDTYTPEYCASNYIEADYHLKFSEVAENSIGTINSGGLYAYYGIKGIPLDRYLICKQWLIYEIGEKLVINKNSGIQKQEVLVYEIEKIEIYHKVKNDNNTSEISDNVLVSLNKDESKEFQDALNEAIDLKNYKDLDEMRKQTERPEIKAQLPRFINLKANNEEVVYFKVYFSSYPNIYWQITLVEIKEDQGDIYLDFNLYSDYGTDNQKHNNVYVSLGEELSAQIREAIEAN